MAKPFMHGLHGFDGPSARPVLHLPCTPVTPGRHARGKCVPDGRCVRRCTICYEMLRQFKNREQVSVYCFLMEEGDENAFTLVN